MDPVSTTSNISDRNMRLIDLAFNCVYLTTPEKENTLKVMEEKSKEDPDADVIELFGKEEYLTPKRIERLLALDIHLQIQDQDFQFGKIATANGLVSEENIAKAISYQARQFKKTGENLKIGDILVENRVITPTEKISILLTQDRIKDENLLDALGNIGETPSQKESVNKRFGVLAIKKDLVTIEQVNQALEIQKKDPPDKPRFIGQILQEVAQLSDEDTLQILLEQKQFEKRRLDLEKALYTVKSEISISKKLNKVFEYDISKDRLKVIVKKTTQTDEIIPVYEFLIWLKRAGIKFGIVNDSTIEAFIQTGEKNAQLVVATGHPAKPSVDESIEFFFENDYAPDQQETKSPEDPDSEPDQTETEAETETEDAGPDKNDAAESDGKKKKESADEKPPENSDNEKEQHPDTEEDQKVTISLDEGLTLVEKGTPLARIIPGKEGRLGKDVLGYPIHPGKPALCPFKAGNGVIRKGSVFIALTDGRPALKEETTLFIEPMVNSTRIKTISGAISTDTKETYEATTLELSGSVTAEAILKCHALFLQGDLSGNVVCTGNIDVKGNIGNLETPKDDEALYPTDVFCLGSVKVSRSILNSRIQTEENLMAINSQVTGSEIIAFKGITVKDVVGNEQGASILQFGLKPGNKILALNQTIDSKKAELSVLKKELEIAELTEKYNTEMAQEEIHQTEQAILKNMIEMIEGPELFQYDGLEAKIDYLKSLPDFSSIKSFYLKIPDTQVASDFVKKIVTSTEKMTPELILKHIQKQIDPEPEDPETAISDFQRIESHFKGNLAAFEKEVEEHAREIEKIEIEIERLQTLKERLGLIEFKKALQPVPAIKVKNQCEKGTVVKGKVATLILERSLYNIQFKEILDTRTQTASIIIETY